MLNIENEAKTNNADDISTSQKVVNIVAIVLCVILIPILVMNCILIVKGLISPNEVPSIFGRIPLIVLTESMDPEIKSGDLIICDEVDPKELNEGDVISFFDPDGNGSTIVTHRIIEVITDTKTGELSFRTKGDNNNAEDQVSVPEKNLVGIYRGRIPGMGNVAMFMQTTPGLIICVVCPIVLLVGYDMLRRRKYDKAKQQDTDALMAELEALRKMQAQQEEAKEK